MTGQDVRIDALEQELRRLRRSTRVLTLLLLATLAIFAIAAAGGPKDVTVRSLTVVDDQQRPRVQLFAAIEGRTGLLLLDESRRTRLRAITDSQSDVFLTLIDPQGVNRVMSHATTEGYGGTRYFDSDGRARVDVATSGGLAGIHVNDVHEKLRIVANTRPNRAGSEQGDARLTLLDAGGKRSWGMESR